MSIQYKSSVTCDLAQLNKCVGFKSYRQSDTNRRMHVRIKVFSEQYSSVAQLHKLAGNHSAISSTSCNTSYVTALHVATLLILSHDTKM